jgi:hypothetical protein
VPLNIEKERGTIRFIDDVVFTLFERDTGTLINPDDERWNIQKPLPVGQFPPSQDIAPGLPVVRTIRSTDLPGGTLRAANTTSNTT